ncbi:ER membrane protein complex subunit 1 isoform X2 [Lucilia cuprina]|uniref:ER membrane protein complex subunit 1 isoform X1 n=1 Tax=Lucilia cuprina TaxID=7375 RepID=UPI001F06D623|nr:ER membrane protein complex subunit 1 isoform X1 [Lucilia cuprina]XP_046805557.1 ER membrane protein complex subunit 1 isoform X2 [Lucilia cuprina]
MHILRNSALQLLAVFMLVVIGSVNSLYEDQIKKFDWRTLQIGGVNQAFLELNGFQPRLLVSTRENVVASLCPKTGEILWRQVFENGARGSVKLLQLSSASATADSTAAARAGSSHGFDMLTVQGHAPALVRGWNSNTGHLEWEWSLMPLQSDKAVNSMWFYRNSLLYHVLPVWHSHLEVTQYFATSGQATSNTAKITAPWISQEKCILTGVYFSCLEGAELISLDLTANQPQVIKKSLGSIPTQPIKALEGFNGIIVVDEKLVAIKDDIHTCSNLNSQSFSMGRFKNQNVIVTAEVKDKNLNIEGYMAETCQPVTELSNSVAYPEHYGPATLRTFDCKANRNNDGKGCLFIFDTTDDSVVAVQQSKIRWSKSEALANVIASEFIDLPLADSEGELENEMKGKTGVDPSLETDIVSAFMHRLTSQMLHFKSVFLHVMGLGPKPSDTQKAGLVRDSFGLHKMLVILTKSGKVFGIDNISGKHHWQLYLNNVEEFANGEQMRLLIQRTSKHFPLQALCTIVAKDKLTGNGVLYRFNPITGAPAEGGLLKLDHKIKQLSLLAETETDYVKGILIMDANNKVNVYPEHAKSKADGLYLYTADKSNSQLNGFYVKFANNHLSTLPLWNVDLAGHTGDHKIITVASKNPIERVHSQGRVMPDRSVLYKYINPNLVAVFTQATDSIHKHLLNVYLIDVVSGSVVFSMMHRKIRPPLHVVHSENWLAYAHYNDKVRRTEITTIELYEGKTQANSTVWSSLNAPPMPLVERQSYIIPTSVAAMRETITERGITSKDVLIGTTSGSIVELPWALLDPRRPISSSSNGREEGAMPYIPELPLPTENMINYNQTIARLRYIYTAPSGLESSCLVVAAGLDLFVTRIAPSKTFDLLKEDFDYILISIVLVVLTSGSLVAKHLASRKSIKQAWK